MKSPLEEIGSLMCGGFSLAELLPSKEEMVLPLAVRQRYFLLEMQSMSLSLGICTSVWWCVCVRAPHCGLHFSEVFFYFHQRSCHFC